ncbi:synaptic vesicle glycoprotein 2B-like [Musca domestica]|uniref:Synaptic vesicle glycoprotein 2B-like n=1 Tax=Musca domestica TaxID=7370 RepID=A0ABM3V9K0_MUSDO|nr:synaptic vesicle glycoprotein 2B-like [Musca domestica]
METSDAKNKYVNNESVADKEQNEPADFEKALHATGFGCFNLLLVLAAIPAKLSIVFSTTTMAYILPIAECDLKLTLFNKGVLNAVTFAGMISSAIVWGYLADTQGRKKILAFGLLADAVCVFCSSLSQNFGMLVTFKFLGGLIVNGPSAVLVTYLTELHAAHHRPRVLLFLGIITSFGTLMLPLLAWLILPRDWEFVIKGFNVHTWQIFLLVCGLPSFISGVILLFLPESPKFLMSQGHNGEAMRAFQTIYALNTRKPKNTFPIKRLIEEVPTRDVVSNEAVFTIEKTSDVTPKRLHRSMSQSLRDGWQQTKPMFSKPLLTRALHVYLMQFSILMGYNTIRLWLPQLFASISEYEQQYANTDESTNLCAILDYSVNKTATIVSSYEQDCVEHKNVSVDMYMNNMIVSISGIVGYCFAGLIVRAVGNKRLLTYGLLISGGLGLSLYWSSSGLTTLIISSMFITLCGISTSSLMGMVVGLFPTTLRTMIVALSMMFGRLGALSGNLMFPVLIEIGCIPPFAMVGSVLIFAAALSFILPKRSIFT